jgi:hypothetical protein
MHSWRWTILALIGLLLAQLSAPGACLLECRCRGSVSAAGGRSAAAKAEHACCALAETTESLGQWAAADENRAPDACQSCPRLCAAERTEKQASTFRARAASPKHTPPALRVPGVLPPALPSLAERALSPPRAVSPLHVSIPTTVLLT